VDDRLHFHPGSVHFHFQRPIPHAAHLFCRHLRVLQEPCPAVHRRGGHLGVHRHSWWRRASCCCCCCRCACCCCCCCCCLFGTFPAPGSWTNSLVASHIAWSALTPQVWGNAALFFPRASLAPPRAYLCVSACVRAGVPCFCCCRAWDAQGTAADCLLQSSSYDNVSYVDQYPWSARLDVRHAVVSLLTVCPKGR
jgi:hypothetical protein